MKIIRSISINTVIDSETGESYKTLNVRIGDTKELLTTGRTLFILHQYDLLRNTEEEINAQLERDTVTVHRAYVDSLEYLRKNEL